MRILKTATAGTLESSDIMISLSPAASTSIEIVSVTGAIYTDAIQSCIAAKLRELGVEGVKLFAKDRGARDCVINARVEAAVERAAKEG